MSIAGSCCKNDHDGQIQVESGCQRGSREIKECELNSAASINHFLQGVERRAFVAARMATRNDDDALDIVQDAMLGLVQNYAGRPDTEWGALFHSILHSKINDWHRRQKVRNRWRVFLPGKTGEDSVDLNLDELVVQTQFPEPDRQLQSDLLGKELVSLIEQLPLRQQQVIVLRAWEGYSIAQTAHIMQCSEGSVKTHFSRAVHVLREKLGDYQ